MKSPWFRSLALGLVLALGLLAVPARADEVAPETAEKPAAIERVPFLWEVDTQPKIYLFGTIHVADKRVLKHPPVVKKALEESKALYTELDFLTAAAALQGQMMIPGGKTLADIAPKELVEKLQKVLAQNGIAGARAKQFQVMRPWLTAAQIPMLVNAARKARKAAEAGAGGDAKPAAPTAAAMPLDLVLYMQARSLGKVVGGLEKPEEQFSVFNDLSLERQLEMLSTSLDAVLAPEGGEEEGGDPVEGLIETYLRGDGEGFQKMLKLEAGKNEEMAALMERLLDKRNVVMVRRMFEAAEKHPDKTMFVAVGAGHYGGDLGIVKLLRSTGFRVRRLNDLAAMEKPWPKVAPVASASSRRAPTRRVIRVGPFCVPLPCPCPRPQR